MVRVMMMSVVVVVVVVGFVRQKAACCRRNDDRGSVARAFHVTSALLNSSLSLCGYRSVETFQ